MPYLGSWKIDDYLTFPANTHNASTGAAADADAVPAYRIYEDETATPIVTGNMALLDSSNTAGFYSEQVQLTAASGFEKGKSYTIYISAAVSSVTGTMSHTFQIEAEVDANTVSATNVSSNVVQISGDGTAADNAESFFDGTGYAGTNNVIPTVTAITNGVTLADDAITSAKIADDAIATEHIATGAISADSFAAGAITATVIANNAIDAATFAADVDAEVATYIWNAATASYGGAGTYGQAVEDTLADTNELQGDITNGGRVDLLVDAIKAKTDLIPAAPAATGDIPSAATIADAVWDEASTGHTDAGKAGQQLWTDVDAILADTGELQTNQGNWLTATGFSTHSAADVWTATNATLSLAYGVIAQHLFETNTHKMEVAESDGDVTLYAADGSTPIATGNVVSSAGTTTRAKLTFS